MAEPKVSCNFFFFDDKDINNTKPLYYFSLSNYSGLSTFALRFIFYSTMIVTWDRQSATFTCCVERFISYADMNIYSWFS